MIYKILHEAMFCKISYVLLGILAASIAGTLSYLVWLFLEKGTAKFHIRIAMHFLRMVLMCYLVPIFPFVVFCCLGTDEERHGFLLHTKTMTVMIVVIVPVCVFVMMSVLVAKYWNYRKKKYLCLDNKPITDKELLALLEKWRKKLRIHRRISLSANKYMNSPGVLYYKGYQIIMPSHMTNNADFRMALLHELVHLKHRDLFTKQIGAMVNVLHGFNPLVKKLREKIEYWSEVACDFAVCEYGKDEFSRQEYYSCLLRLKLSSQEELDIKDMCGLAEKQSMISFRVHAVHNVTEREMYTPLYGYVVTLAILAMVILGSVEASWRISQNWFFNIANYTKEKTGVYLSESDTDNIFKEWHIVYSDEQILDREDSYDFVIYPDEVILFDISEEDLDEVWVYAWCRDSRYSLGCIDNRGQLWETNNEEYFADWIKAEEGSIQQIFIQYWGEAPIKVEFFVSSDYDKETM